MQRKAHPPISQKSPVRQFSWDDVLNRYVVALFVGQVVGFTVLVALFDHSPTPLVSWAQALPETIRLVLLPVGLLAIPAVLLSLAIDALLSIVGHSPESLPALLVARGDALVFGSAYSLAIAGAWAFRNYEMRSE